MLDELQVYYMYVLFSSTRIISESVCGDVGDVGGSFLVLLICFDKQQRMYMYVHVGRLYVFNYLIAI